MDEYLASQPESARAVLERVRGAIRKALPGAEEVISYQVPAYQLHGRVVLFFAGWREHFSLYPATAELVAALKDELAPYEMSKGTIRFPLEGRVPVGLIARIAKLKAAEAAKRAKTKRAASKRKPARP